MAQEKVAFKPAPGVLRWARESVGLTVADVACRLGVTRETVTKWEAGEREVLISRLEALAHLYRRPLAALFLPAPPETAPLPHDFRTLPAGAKAPLSRETLLSIREARRIQRVARELAADLGQVPTAIGPAVGSHGSPEHLAARERERIGITVVEQRSWRRPDIALRRWREVMENLGILVLQFPMPMEDARGFSLSEDSPPVLVLNSGDAANARIFTLFHEYAHVLRGSSALCIPAVSAETLAHGEHEEVFCNAFAGAFLAPREAFTDALAGRRADDQVVAELAAEFSVSQHVILHRLKGLELLSRAAFEHRLHQLEVRQAETIRPKGRVRRSAAQRCIGTRGKRFVRLVLGARARDLITGRDVADYLSLRVRHFDALEALAGEGEAGAPR
jgi:Zn-dependent peptidase ImmA (M78 family)/DNA-binding XRE family transcriptional regulator